MDLSIAPDHKNTHRRSHAKSLPPLLAGLLCTVLACTQGVAQTKQDPVKDPPVKNDHTPPARTVFVCSIDTAKPGRLDLFRKQLAAAIDMLDPAQSFNIILLSKDSYTALDKQSPTATPENRRKATDFLRSRKPERCQNPIPGLEAALANKPNMIYFLADGDFRDNPAVLQQIRKLNPNSKVKITTIGFLQQGESYEKLLSDIARENRGLFKFVTENDLER